MFSQWTAKSICACNTILGEGPVWLEDKQVLYFTDILSRRVLQYNPANGNLNSIATDSLVSIVAPAATGELLLAMQGKLALLDESSQNYRTILHVETDTPENRCNDGKCDANGRLWFGTMHMDAHPQKGALYCFDGQLRKVLDHVSISNGLCWSADNTTMYYIDTADRNIRAFDFELSTGTISNPGIIIHTDTYPDGMCIDREGMLWVAMWGGAAVHRYDPATGQLIGKIEVPALHVTSCAFGGPDMQTLYITTAREGLAARQLAAWPQSGHLFAAYLPVAGLPANRFSISLL